MVAHPFMSTDIAHLYVESLYTITTTISTVGYGDYKGFYDDQGHWSAEMVYLIFVELLGIILMSTVMEKIFDYNKLQTVEEIVKDKVFKMEVFLYDISLLRSDKVLPL